MSRTMFVVKIKLNVKNNIRGQNQVKCQEQCSWSKSSKMSRIMFEVKIKLNGKNNVHGKNQVKCQK